MGWASLPALVYLTRVGIAIEDLILGQQAQMAVANSKIAAQIVKTPSTDSHYIIKAKIKHYPAPNFSKLELLGCYQQLDFAGRIGLLAQLSEYLEKLD